MPLFALRRSRSATDRPNTGTGRSAGHPVRPPPARPHFDDVDPATVDEDLLTYAEHCARSGEVLAGRPLDARLRWRYLYLVKEYARHLGHADLLRARLDGATGE